MELYIQPLQKNVSEALQFQFMMQNCKKHHSTLSGKARETETRGLSFNSLENWETRVCREK